MKKIAVVLFYLVLSPILRAQISRFGEDITFSTSIQATAGNGEVAPFWFTSNRYGLGTTEPNSALVRASIQRDISADSLNHWKLGYGADIVGAINHDSKFILQQLYADIQFKAIRLSVGQKERPLELKNQQLSSGGLTTGINARPLPQVRLELPEFWTIPRTKGWLAIKAHIAYGWYTDNKWQRKFTSGTANLYTANSLYHSKAGFLRIGNPEKFPVTLTGGLEMSAQFGGEAWNLLDRADHDGTFSAHQKMNSGLKGYLHAFIPSGSDANDGDFANVEGNQLGSWHMRIDFEKKDWGASFYLEHFFEDHSQLFMQYDWKDMLYGAELNFPQNPVVSTLLYEHIRTTHQSGSIYHDETSTLPVSIYGIDNYYNHHIYGGWQHAGFTLGNPLLLSPVYNSNGLIAFCHNRIKVNHIGIEGKPFRDIAYRFLYTHSKSFGTYDVPTTDPLKQHSVLIEATYCPHQVKGLSVTASYGQNKGDMLGSSKGGMLTLCYTGILTGKKK